MKFLIWDTSLDVFKFLWRERRIAMRFSGVPVGIYLLLTIAVQFLFGAKSLEPGTEAATAFTAPLLILGFIQVALFLPVAVTWYRFVVLGAKEAQRRPLFTLGRLEGRYLLWQAIVTLVVLSALAIGGMVVFVMVGLSKAIPIFGLIAVASSIALLVGVFLLMTRFSMVLVLASLDKPVSLQTSWDMTKGITMQLLAATALVVLGMLFLAVPAGVVMGIFGGILKAVSAAGAASFLNFATQSVAGLVGVLAVATLFGFAYLKLVDHAAAGTVAADTAP